MLPADHWAASLATHRSRGSQAKRPGSLAGLHAARQAHVGQFFTPPGLADYLWRFLAPLRAASKAKLTVLDNSAGIGRLIWPAQPDEVCFHAIDIDGEACEALAKACDEAGLEAEVLNAPLQDTDPGRADVAIINPPFGLTLTSPAMTPRPGITSHGPFGPSTSAPSIPLAIAHALDAAPLVIAIVPAGFDPTAYAPLAAFHAGTIHLPAGLFRDQGTDVRVQVSLFHQHGVSALIDHRAVDLADAPPALPEDWILSRERARPPSLIGINTDLPTIRRDVTGDPSVRICHDGRKVILKTRCAFTEAVARNLILRAPVRPPEGHRLPKAVRFEGQGWLDLENWLVTGDPLRQLDALCGQLRDAGLQPEPDASLVGYLRRRQRRDAIMATPFRRWVRSDGVQSLSAVPLGEEIPAKAHSKHLARPKQWGSPVILPTDQLHLVPSILDGQRTYEVRRAGACLRHATSEEITRDYAFELPPTGEWTLLHAGRAAAFPDRAAAVRRHAMACGVDAFLGGWRYQLDDAIELSMAPRGAAAWTMGLGKTRLAIGLALMGGAANLIVVDAHLVPEFEEEFEKIGLDDSLWQVINEPSQLEALRKINVISYSRLRMPLCEGAGRRTFASRLRRRVHTVIADEAHKVRNRDTAQTQALYAISPKRRYALTGTPAANYVRDALPLVQWSSGDGTATQRLGFFHPVITARNLQSMSVAERGVDRFADLHVTMEWATREFTEDLQEGAKREVPKLRNIELFRETFAPHLLRRVATEPEVACYFKIPVPTHHVHDVEWDHAHLCSYVTVAERFADWYRKAKGNGTHDNHLNLVTLLARVGAVVSAANVPERMDGPVPAYGADTSKHRAAVKLLEQWTSEGQQSVMFATSPATLQRISRRLAEIGIESVIYDGTTAIGPRTKQLRRWKRGEVPVLLATFGAAQVGLNLPQGSRVLLYNRDWTPRTEHQAIARLLRPQQKNAVQVHYLHLRGSIDIYQAMMVAQKADAIGAGIDYEDAELADEEFLHLDTVLARFVDAMAKDLGLAGYHELKEQLIIPA